MFAKRAQGELDAQAQGEVKWPCHVQVGDILACDVHAQQVDVEGLAANLRAHTRGEGVFADLEEAVAQAEAREYPVNPHQGFVGVFRVADEVQDVRGDHKQQACDKVEDEANHLG